MLALQRKPRSRSLPALSPLGVRLSLQLVVMQVVSKGQRSTNAVRGALGSAAKHAATKTVSEGEVVAGPLAMLQVPPLGCAPPTLLICRDRTLCPAACFFLVRNNRRLLIFILEGSIAFQDRVCLPCCDARLAVWLATQVTPAAASEKHCIVRGAALSTGVKSWEPFMLTLHTTDAVRGSTQRLARRTVWLELVGVAICVRASQILLKLTPSEMT